MGWNAHPIGDLHHAGDRDWQHKEVTHQRPSEEEAAADYERVSKIWLFVPFEGGHDETSHDPKNDWNRQRQAAPEANFHHACKGAERMQPNQFDTAPKL